MAWLALGVCSCSDTGSGADLDASIDAPADAGGTPMDAAETDASISDIDAPIADGRTDDELLTEFCVSWAQTLCQPDARCSCSEPAGDRCMEERTLECQVSNNAERSTFGPLVRTRLAACTAMMERFRLECVGGWGLPPMCGRMFGWDVPVGSPCPPDSDGERCAGGDAYCNAATGLCTDPLGLVPVLDQAPFCVDGDACPPARHCEDGLCHFTLPRSCPSRVLCDLGQICKDGFCIAGPAPGDPCEVEADCGFGSSCVRPRVCSHRRAPGAACDPDDGWLPCVPSATCTDEGLCAESPDPPGLGGDCSSVGCTTGLYCVGSTCREPGDLGAECYSFTCRDGLYCVAGRCAATPVPVGGRCSWQDECDASASCAIVAKEHETRCVAGAPGLGEPCDYNRVCSSGLSCLPVGPGRCEPRICINRSPWW